MSECVLRSCRVGWSCVAY